MKRKNKNIISIVIIILLCASIIFTGYLSINRNNENKIPASNREQFNNVPPNMPTGSNQGEIPEMPGGNNQNREQPPEIPEGGNQNTGNPPEPPAGEMNEPNNQPGNMEQPPDMPSDNEQHQFGNEVSKDSSNIVYGIAFGIESLLLSVIILYLLMSNGNEKSLKGTFESNDKKIIFILSVLVLTVGLTSAEIAISDKLVNSERIVFENKNPGMPGEQNINISYSSANEITKSIDEKDKEYSSTKKDENALLVSGKIEVSLSNITIEKSGDSDGGDNTSFYGINSAIIGKDGASLTLKNIVVTTDAVGANGVFSYGGSATTKNSSTDGTTINISDSTITTKKDNSGGIMTTGGGIMNASNLTITTSGTSSAAIRTDRGGGTVNVEGGTYKTTGSGSPSIYSTANITVKNATLEATSSEGIVIEGKNKVSLEKVTLTDTNNKLNGLSTTYKNIFLYQSMSGDADTGISEFSAKDSTITTNKGDTLYITNTSSKITLTNNKIVNNDSNGNFLRAQKDSWGNNGSNGGIVELVLSNQEVKGSIVIDSISTLDMTMEDNSYYEGIINGDNSAKSIQLTLDKSSKIKLTGDSYITYLEDSEKNYDNIDFNGYKLYVNGKSIN